MDLLNALVALLNFVVLPAVSYGSQLALGALGVTLIYGILRFSNFAHGDTMAFGAMSTILFTWFLQSLGVSLGPLPTALLALPVGIAATALLVLTTDRLVYRFYREQKAAPVILVIVSMGVMFVMNGLVRFIIGVDDQRFADGKRFIITARDFKEMTGLNEGLAIKSTTVLTVVVAIIVVAALFWFLNRTRTGKSMRAFSDNEDLALLSGISPERVVAITWIIVAALATIAGTLYGLDKSFKPFTYFQLLLPIFAAAIVGGLGNPIGAIAGGFVIAFSEVTITYAFKKVAGYVLPSWEPDGLIQLLSTDYKFAVSFAILIVVLLFRPTGLFRGKARMTLTPRDITLFFIVFALIAATGFTQSWNVALGIFNMGLISAIMALGVNMQWGYAGLFNVGVMGFVALGGLGAVVVSMPPVGEAWAAGGLRVILALIIGIGTIVAATLTWTRLPASKLRALILIGLLVVGFFVFRAIFDPAVDAIEAISPATTGYLGGLGLPVLIAWPIGGALAAGAAWIVGKTALGLRSDYLAIATLGIAEIVIAVLKNEDWLSRGVKNVIGVPRPVPYEIDLQNSETFVNRMTAWGFDPVTASSITVKLAYAGLFLAVLIILLWLAQSALNSPWGRMMRAIRDNEVAAEAMGKDVTRRHLQIFILGSAVCGLAGAMMTTLDGQLTPGTYQPLRFTFLIWVMVIVGGSGNNMGSVLGGFIIWLVWIEAEPVGVWLMKTGTLWMDDGSALKQHLIDNAQHMRLFFMGLVLLLVLRFSPGGILPEVVRKRGGD